MGETGVPCHDRGVERRIDRRRLSKTVAHALRHAPADYGLDPDAAGWVDVRALLDALREKRPAWAGLTGDDLAWMIEASDKRRYEIRGGRIRALYGHSYPVASGDPELPPEHLYHGTPPRSAERILAEGLRPMGRHRVHLSVDVRDAVAVGKRRSPEPAVLRVRAAGAHDAGVAFYPSASALAGRRPDGGRELDRIWLAEAIPPRFIDLLDQPAP